MHVCAHVARKQGKHSSSNVLCNKSACPFLLVAHKEEQKSKVADRKRKQQIAADEVSEAKRSSEDASQEGGGVTENETQEATQEPDCAATTVQSAESEMEVDITTEPADSSAS